MPYEYDGYISHEEYTFEAAVDPRLEELADEYEHIFNGSHKPEILATWSLDKPGSTLEILPPEEHQATVLGMEETIDSGNSGEIGEFLYEIGRWFHWYFDGYNLHISRFEGIPQMLAVAYYSGQLGVLYGYPTFDVAQTVIDSGSSSESFKCRP